MKAILAISVATGYGGGERSFEELLKALNAEDRVFLMVENKRHFGRCRSIMETTSGGSLYRLPSIPRPLQILVGMLWTGYVWLRHRPQYAIANSSKSGFILAASSFLISALKKNSVLYIRDFQWAWKEFTLRRLANALILVPSEAVSRHPFWSQLVLASKSENWQVVPNIVTTDTESRREPENGVDEQRVPYVLSLGALQPWKGQDQLIRALTLLPRELCAIFCGGTHDHGYEAYVRKLAADLGVADRVQFLPFAENPSYLIAEALCVTVTSISEHSGPETFGRAVIEAWAEQTPIIAYEVGGPKYLITHKVNGLLVPENDWKALAESIRMLSEDPQLARSLAEAGSSEVAEHYCREAVHRRYKQAICAWLPASF